MKRLKWKFSWIFRERERESWKEFSKWEREGKKVFEVFLDLDEILQLKWYVWRDVYENLVLLLSSFLLFISSIFFFPLPSSSFPLWFSNFFSLPPFLVVRNLLFPSLSLVREREGEELEMMIMINIISFPSSLAFVYFARKRKEGKGKERDFNFASLSQVATKIRAEK